MAGGRRLTVRFDFMRAAALQAMCLHFRLSPSAVVRLAVDRLHAAPPSGHQSPASRSGVAPTLAVTTPKPLTPSPALIASRPEVMMPPGAKRPNSLPAEYPKVAERLGYYRAVGGAIREERRILFRNLVAAAVVAKESAEEPRDAELCQQLLQLGRAYSLLS